MSDKQQSCHLLGSDSAEGLDLSRQIARLLVAVLREAAQERAGSAGCAPEREALPTDAFFTARTWAALGNVACPPAEERVRKFPQRRVRDAGTSLFVCCAAQERMSAAANYLLRLLYYPAATQTVAPTAAAAADSDDREQRAERVGAGASATSSAAAAEADSGAGEWGISAHCDFELFTIMHQSAPGLEARSVCQPRPCFPDPSLAH